MSFIEKGKDKMLMRRNKLVCQLGAVLLTVSVLSGRGALAGELSQPYTTDVTVQQLTAEKDVSFSEDSSSYTDNGGSNLSKLGLPPFPSGSLSSAPAELPLAQTNDALFGQALVAAGIAVAGSAAVAFGFGLRGGGHHDA